MLFDQNGDFKIQQLFSYPNDNYKNLKEEALKCRRCQLRENANGVVMGEGNLDNKIMLIGEGPGANEDRLGRPFVGRAGKIMDNLKKELKINIGETTEDGLFTLEGCRCIGACGLAPVLTVNDQVHGRLTENDVPSLIRLYKLKEEQAI